MVVALTADTAATATRLPHRHVCCLFIRLPFAFLLLSPCA
jgi:hypothetical protein